ncbi:MAG TPA: hypothetical protein VFH80_17510 [Solirubrobacteraceae bacterium]|nr:hypothetical protein [Solirubrobacteraceae bacterium]
MTVNPHTLELAALEAARAIGPHRPTAEEMADLFTPVERAAIAAIPPGAFDMWPLPDPENLRALKREAVAAVLARYEAGLTITTELLDELIAAAETGI